VDLDFIGPPALPLPAEEAVPRSGEAVDVATLELFGLGVGSGDLEGSSGNLTTVRGGWKVGLGQYRARGFGFAVELGTEGSFYDYGGGASPVPGVNDPFNDVYDTHVAARFLQRGAGRLDVYGGLQVGNAGEDAVSIDDSLYLGGALACRYNARDDFALIVGFAGLSRFDDSPWILPYIGFDWRVNEDLRLRTEAAEVHADFRLAEDWELGLEAVYDLRQYRLNDSGPLNHGSVRDEEVRAGASLGWRPSENVLLELVVGKVLWRELRFHDGVAGDLGESEVNGSLYLGLGLDVGF